MVVLSKISTVSRSDTQRTRATQCQSASSVLWASSTLSKPVISVSQAILLAFLAARGKAADSVDPPLSHLPRKAQADYVGAYLLARAGYDLDAVRRVWKWLERIETPQAGWGSELAQAHPPTKERLAAFETTLQEIETKQKAAQPLEIGPREEH